MERKTHCIRKHSVPSSGRKERTLPALLVKCQRRICSVHALLLAHDLQAVQSDAIVQRHDAVPAVSLPVGLVAQSDAAEVAFVEGEGSGDA